MESKTKLYRVQCRITLPEDSTPYSASGIFIDDHDTSIPVICDFVEANLRGTPKTKDAKIAVTLHLITVEFMFKSVLK